MCCPASPFLACASVHEAANVLAAASNTNAAISPINAIFIEGVVVTILEVVILILCSSLPFCFSLSADLAATSTAATLTLAFPITCSLALFSFIHETANRICSNAKTGLNPAHHFLA
jgi:hypothetical protein